MKDKTAMPVAKRLLDIVLALILVVILAIPFGILVLYLCIKQRGQLFYVSERMKAVDKPFQLWKLRTMSVVDEDSGVSGGDKSDRVTALGHVMRRFRVDEIPQLWNVLRGDMSFVGPRPPLRLYVEKFPEIYADVLECRPGITGMASLYFHRHEEYLLAKCRSAEETDDVYSRLCVPKKAKLDLIYKHSYTICLDFYLIYMTGYRVCARRQKKVS